MSDYLRILDDLETAAAQLRVAYVPEEGTADTVGRVRAVERSLADTRRVLVSEIDGDLHGDRYTIRDGRKADRSYGTQAILASITDALDTTSVAYALRWLQDHGAVKLVWSWRALETAFSRAGAELRIQQSPIDEDTVDGPHVGVTWRRDVRIEGKGK